MQPHLKLPHNNIAFVLGNGTSRLAADPNALKSTGTVYACNAIYREFEPHYLIAVDVKMVNEIVASGWHKTHQVWTNPNKGITNSKDLNFFSPHKGWSSGPTALWFACTQGHKDVYIFGFDYKGTDGKFNNVYADTFNYKKSTDAATFFGNWVSQTEKVIQEFRNINFYRIIENNALIPEKLSSELPNLKHIYFDDFAKEFPGTIYSDQTIQKNTI